VGESVNVRVFVYEPECVRDGKGLRLDTREAECVKDLVSEPDAVKDPVAVGVNGKEVATGLLEDV
jgi:hypothetical protein